MYKLFKASTMRGGEDIIQRTTDDTFIPRDSGNLDYRDFLKWLEEGNTPEPADDPESV